MAVISNLSIAFSNFKLQVDHLELPDRGVTAIIGPSGSGKSTFFNVLIGVLNPPDWSWKKEGLDLAQLSIEKRRLGVVFQNYELFPHMTAHENLEIAYSARGRKNFRLDVDPLIEKLGLSKCMETKAALLSGGEQQRIALLRALISEPEVLLLDEPFAALDPDLRDSARDAVREVLQHVQIPVYLITHDETDVKKLAQYVVSLANGSFSAVKKVDE